MVQSPLETRREYVRELSKLKLWYVWWLRKQGEADFETAITKRVGLWQMTLFWEGPAGQRPEESPGWRELAMALREVFDAHDSAAGSSAVEREGLALLSPHLEAALERDLSVAARWLEDAIGCFSYEFRPFYAEPESDDHLTLHVRNAHQPDSPFQHASELVANLQQVVSRAESERPEVEWAQCATWLNSLPPFARLFPPVWTETSRLGAPGNHTGWWGQFMDRRGGFHAANARRLRETGQFPYTHRLCRCPVTDLRRHLAELAHDR